MGFAGWLECIGFVCWRRAALGSYAAAGGITCDMD